MLPSRANFAKLLGLVFIALSLFAAQQVYAADPVVDPTVDPAASSGSVAPNTPDTSPPDAAPPPPPPKTVNVVPTASDMIERISKQLPSLMYLVTAIAYVMGLVLVILCIMKLKHAGESRTMMSQEHSMKGPIIYMAVGAALIYLPSTVQVGLSTFWTVPNPYGYVIEGDQWTQVVGTCLMVIQFFGVLAFIRGLVMLASLAGHGGGHQGGFGKALTHIIGGIFCINIYQFVQVFMVTLGIQSPF
jgi:hypothetical protein